MPAVDPQALAALLRKQSPMAGQGAISDQERAMAQQGMGNQMAGQGAISEAERAMAMQAMQGMGQPAQQIGGMGQMSEADRKFLMMQQGQ